MKCNIEFLHQSTATAQMSQIIANVLSSQYEAVLPTRDKFWLHYAENNYHKNIKEASEFLT